MEELRACRACLATDTVLFNIHDYKKAANFTLFTGYSVTLSDGLPQHLCNSCCIALHRCTTFRNSCILTQDLLNNAVVQHNVINTEFIRNLDRQSLGITPQLSITNTEVTNEYPHIENDIKQEYEIISEPKLETDLIISHNVIITNDTNSYETQSKNYDNIVQTKSIKIEIFSPSKSDSDEPPVNDSKTIIEPIERVEKPIKKVKEPIRKVKKPIVKVERPVNKVKKRIGKFSRKPFNEDYAKVLILTKEEQLKEVEARKLSKNYISSSYKCDKCYKGFVEEGAYVNHMVRHYPSTGAHKCDVCHVRFQTARDLRQHGVKIHERKYQCNKCKFISSSPFQAKDHDKWHQGFTYSCQFCKETFSKKTTHLTHLRTNHPTEFVCEICSESFISAYGLATHKRKSHIDVKFVIKIESYCDTCKIQFNTIDALNKHKISSAKHNGDIFSSISCKVCGGCFEYGSQLIEHSKLHKEKRFQCDQCEHSFSTARTRTAHFKRMHLGIKQSITKNVVCEVCGKKCTCKAALSYHQRKHTGEKPYQCTMCTKRFGCLQKLKLHTRTHTNERPFACAHCEKAFKQKAALNRHSLIHSGLKPYTCNYCAKSFSQSNSMKVHVNTVHLKLPQPYPKKKRKVDEKKSKNAATSI